MMADFHSRLAEELLGLFNLIHSLPPASARSIESDQVYRYKLHLRFCNALTSEQAGLSNVPNAFSDSLLLSLEEIFIEKALIPSLKDSASPSLVRDTLLAKESLQLCSGPLQGAHAAKCPRDSVAHIRSLVRHIHLAQRGLAGAAAARFVVLAHPQHRCDAFNRYERAVIARLAAHSPPATMRLFDVICGLYHPHATESLMVSHLKTQPLVVSATAATDETISSCTFEPILNSFPGKRCLHRPPSLPLC